MRYNKNKILLNYDIFNRNNEIESVLDKFKTDSISYKCVAHNDIKITINTNLNIESILNTIKDLNFDLDSSRFKIYWIDIVDTNIFKQYHIYIIDYDNQESLIDVVYLFNNDGITATHYYAIQKNNATIFNNRDEFIYNIINNDKETNIISRLVNIFKKIIK